MSELVGIDFAPIASVANNLIDKIAQGTGYLFTKETPEKIAFEGYVADIRNSSLSPIHKAVLISNAKRDIKQYANQKNIVEEAQRHLEETDCPQGMDDDWLNAFMDKARLISDKEVQKIWSKILAGECNNPGKFSKRLLNTLFQMERASAETFTKICRVTVKIIKNNGDTEINPIIFLFDNENYYKSIGLTEENLKYLALFGLVEFSSMDIIAEYACYSECGFASVNYFDNILKIPQNIRNLEIGNLKFTQIGEELFNAITVNCDEKFWNEICIPSFEKCFKDRPS